MRLEELVVYQLSMEVAEKIWAIVEKWGYFARNTMGKQLIRAVDSVAANVSEGYGRYHYKENKQFCYFSRGSLYETKTWLTKAHERKLIEEEDFDSLMNDLEIIGRKLNSYIKSIGARPTQAK